MDTYEWLLRAVPFKNCAKSAFMKVGKKMEHGKKNSQ